MTPVGEFVLSMMLSSMLVGCGAVTVGPEPVVAAAQVRVQELPQKSYGEPVVIKRVWPIHPLELRRAYITGEVVVDFTITGNGEVIGAKTRRPNHKGGGEIVPHVQGAPLESEVRMSAADLQSPEKVRAEMIRREAALIGNAESMFATAVLAAMVQWKYKPAMLDGQPVPFPMQLTMTFDARKSRAEISYNGVPVGLTLGSRFEISMLDKIPIPSKQAKPKYPFEMRRAGIAGEVVVDFTVTEAGEVTARYVTTRVLVSLSAGKFARLPALTARSK